MTVVLVWLVRIACFFILAYAAIQFIGAFHGIRGTDPLDGLRGGKPLTSEEIRARRREGLGRLGCGVILVLGAGIVLLLTY